MSSYSLQVNQCLSSRYEVLKYFEHNLCVECYRIPFPSIKDRSNPVKIYCEQCGNSAGIKSALKPSRQEVENLNKLVINCSKHCGKTFTFSTKQELIEHELICTFTEATFNNDSKIFLQNSKRDTICSDCDTVVFPTHDCIYNINKKITGLYKVIHEIQKEQKDKFYFDDKIIEKNSEVIKTTRFIEKLVEKLNKKKERTFALKESCYEGFINDNFKIKLEIKLEYLAQRDLSNIIDINKPAILNHIQQKLNIIHQKILKNNIEQNLIKDDNISSCWKELQSNLVKISETEDTKIFAYETVNFNEKLEIYLATPITGNIENILKRHRDMITHMQIHNKNTLITSSKDRSIKFWDLKTMKFKGSINNANSDYIYSFLIIKNTNRLVLVGLTNQIKFWNIDNFKQESKHIDNKSYSACIIQTDDDTIVVGSFDRLIKYYDFNTKELIFKITTDHDGYIYRIHELNIKNIHIILSGSYDKSLKVWFGQNCVHTLNGHSQTISDIIQLEYDNRVLISADWSGKIIFWNVTQNFREIHTINIEEYSKELLTQERQYVRLLELKSQKVLVTCTSYSNLTFWSLIDYKILRNLRLSQGITCICEFNNQEGIIFNIREDIIIWK